MECPARKMGCLAILRAYVRLLHPRQIHHPYNTHQKARLHFPHRTGGCHRGSLKPTLPNDMERERVAPHNSKQL